MSDVRSQVPAYGDAASASAPQRNATFTLKMLLLAGMGAVFFVTYGFSNWLAGQHAHVPSFAFAWEQYIPFWPWTIVPYWSIDLLYAASFFLWTQRDELLGHAKRLLTTQSISFVCFVLWPLRFGFERPPVSGVSGALFTLLAGFDKPFNQAPSLHIGLLVVLWVLYATRLRGFWRGVVHVWFAMIGLSVFTTYQHHMIDVPTGAAVGCFALFLFPMPGVRMSTVDAATRAQARRLAWRYAMGAAVGLAAACFTIPVAPAWSLLLGWIALALLCVAIVYWRADPALFQKDEHGNMPWPALMLFAPTIFGMFVNSRLWTLRHPAPTPVHDDVFVGRIPTSRALRRAGITAVVDLTAEMPRWGGSGSTLAYVCVPQLDLVLPTLAQIRQTVAAIDTLRASGHRVLVCCALGYSRSALSTCCWLADHLQLDDAQEAVVLLRAARPQIVLSTQGVALIQHYIAQRAVVAAAVVVAAPTASNRHA